MAKHIFLTYNEWDGDYHKGFNINHRNLMPKEIQNAIDDYIMRKNKVFAENKRLERLVDELMNENKCMKNILNNMK